MARNQLSGLPKMFTIAGTIIRLGIANVLYVAWYRFTIKTGIRMIASPVHNINRGGDFFNTSLPVPHYPDSYRSGLLKDAEKISRGCLQYFSYHWKNVGLPPDWFLNPFSNNRYPGYGVHWTKLSDFHPGAGDIKIIWEASRFGWLSVLSRAYRVTGNDSYLNLINGWLSDWCASNPVNSGPNWKCGQEASVRVFSLIYASLVLTQCNNPTFRLQDLVYEHLKRIQSGIRYGVAQNNNHGTSEAAALYIGGNWLVGTGYSNKNAQKFANTGLKWLENRTAKLIEEDGGFSQYSVNYQRMVIDTLTFCEYWRQRLLLPEFSDLFYKKARAAINWLYYFTDEDSFNCPNLGSNDGSLLLNLHSCDYSDFRPSLQTAGIIFKQPFFFSSGIWDEPLFWLDREKNSSGLISPKRESRVFKSGYVIIKSSNSWGMIRFPYFRFRPAQSDIFHFDLWHNGVNILTDSGTYSYNPDEAEEKFDFKSVHAHNTVTFDEDEQMPVLGRFLYGNWTRADYTGDIHEFPDGGKRWEGAYKDLKGNLHKRTIICHDREWHIEDEIDGNFRCAVIGFNFVSDSYSIEGNEVKTSWGKFILPEGLSFMITKTMVSSYYLEKHPVNRLVITTYKPKMVKVMIRINR